MNNENRHTKANRNISVLVILSTLMIIVVVCFLVIKSRKDLYEGLEEAIRKVHPYEMPEILATPVTKGSESYLEWLDNELGKGDQ